MTTHSIFIVVDDHADDPKFVRYSNYYTDFLQEAGTMQ